MGKVEDFSKVIKVVTELTDVSEQDILGKSRAQEVVDARWMALYLMRQKGYTTAEIVEVSHFPERTINHAIHRFPYRISRFNCNLGNIYYQARQQFL